MIVLSRRRLAAFALAALVPVAAVAQETAKPSSPPVTAGWRDGFVIQSEKGDFRLQIGLFVQADGRFAIDDEDDAITDTFVIRRARPSLRGRFADRYEFYVNPDFAGGTLTLQDAYFEIRFSSAFRVRLGKTKTPFGLERLMSASNLLFFERAYPNSIVPNRDVGVHVLGDLAGGVIGYQAAVLNGVPDGGSGDTDNNDSKDVAGRIVLRPFNGSAGPLKGFGVALAGTTGTQQGTLALPSIRTTLLMQPFLSYTGASADGRRTRYSPQFFYYHKAFGGLGEYVHTHTAMTEGDAHDGIAHDAWQLAGSFLLTGETATDGAVRPAANFDFGHGHLGALQVAARFHTLKVDEEAITLGFAIPGSSSKAEAWTVGLTWFWTPNLKYVVNFERTVFDGDPEGPRPAENALVFRSQINF
jgi:phosphate-selective porin OprO/OprP